MSRFVIHCTWDEVPHLTDEQKKDLWESFPAYQREARFRGVPVLGSGRIYTVAEEELKIKDFEIPEHWPRAYALDVGWNVTAAIWGALDRETQTTYLYNEYYRGQAEPAVHAAAIRGRGEWIPGVIDPAAKGRAQKDGIQLMRVYRDLGLNIQSADHSVEAGVHRVWKTASAGQLRVFESCNRWFEEYRMYRRDDKGNIVKDRDHLMDCTRYLFMSGLNRAKVQPVKNEFDSTLWSENLSDAAWMVN